MYVCKSSAWLVLCLCGDNGTSTTPVRKYSKLNYDRLTSSNRLILYVNWQIDCEFVCRLTNSNRFILLIMVKALLGWCRVFVETMAPARHQPTITESSIAKPGQHSVNTNDNSYIDEIWSIVERWVGSANILVEHCGSLARRFQITCDHCESISISIDWYWLLLI